MKWLRKTLSRFSGKETCAEEDAETKKIELLSREEASMRRLRELELEARIIQRRHAHNKSH